MFHIIFNPVAGKGRASNALSHTLQFLADHGLEHQLITTERPDHATELAAATPPDATILVMGGDGTVHEVVKGIVACGPSERTLAVLPVGSGDDFAFSLGMRHGDLQGALARLLAPKVRLVDVGFVDGEPFANSMGAGFDAEAAHRVRTSPRMLKGVSAYLYGVLTALGSFSPVGVTVTVDGVVAYRGPSLLVSLQNGPRTGGSFLFAPEARNDDGLFDVVVAGEFGRAGAMAILPRLARGRHLDHPKVHLFRGANVVIQWDQPQRAHIDGEGLGPRERYAAHIGVGVLRVIH